MFTLPEDDVNEIQKQMAAGTLAVTAYDRTNSKLIATGTLATTDNQIDSTTGTVKLRAMFPNTDNALFPQQFVNARLLLETLKNVVVAPQAAVQQGAPGSFVYLVQPDNTVHVQVVKTGVSEGTQVQITDGLKPGDKVVTDGLDRLRDGARISIAQPPGQAPAGAAAEPPAGRRRGNRPDAAPVAAPAGAPSGG
jgi:multidrug efflux system membrane fusion protein